MTAGARIVVAFAAVSLLLATVSVEAQVAGMEAVESAGPLDAIWITADLGCQVHQRGWTHNAFAPGLSRVGACGTFLSIQPHDVPPTLYGPSHLLAAAQPDPTDAMPPPATARGLPYIVLEEQQKTGAGTVADPFVIESRVLAGVLEVTQRDTYVVGATSYRTEIEVVNPGPEHPDVVLWRAATCDLGQPTYGAFGEGAWAACTTAPPGQAGEHIMLQTSSAKAMEGPAKDVWRQVAYMQPFPDTCDCDAAKTGAIGVSWSLHLEPGDGMSVVHETHFGQGMLMPPPVPPPQPPVEPACGAAAAPAWCEPPPPGRAHQPSYWPGTTHAHQAPPTISGVSGPRQAYLDTPGGEMGSADGDQVADREDLCLGVIGGAEDLDGDGLGDACDVDRDGDGILDAMDACFEDPDVNCGILPVDVADVRPGAAASRKPLPTTPVPEPGAGSVEVASSTEGQAGPVIGLTALGCTFLLVVATLRRRS